MNHTRCPTRPLRPTKKRGQRGAFKWHLHALHRISAQSIALVVRCERLSVCDSLGRISVTRHALREQVVDAGAHILSPCAEMIPGVFVALRERLGACGDLHEAFAPCFLRRGVAPLCMLAERTAGLVELEEIG